MVGAIELGDNPESMADVVPIARLADDYAALVVPADSKFKTLDDFLARLEAKPRRKPQSAADPQARSTTF